MASATHVLRIFFASPADVEDERALAVEVIRELNLIWGDELGVRLDLMHWTTHTIPGFGSDAQEVINSDIGLSYDVFIAVFWSRFGTPTPRAGSGTEEEFDRALARFRADPSAVRIMVYFKTAPPPPTEDAGSELAKIAAFRAKVAAQGGLFGSFSATADFATLLRLHLSRFVQQWLRCRGSSTDAASSQFPKGSPSGDQSATELIGLFAIHMAAFIKTGARVERAVDEFSAHLEEQVQQAQDLRARGEWTKTTMEAQARRWAAHLDAFGVRVEVELPALRTEFREGFSAIGRSAALFQSFGPDASGAFQQALGTVRTTRGEVEVTAEAIRVFGSVVRLTPPITPTLDDAKNRVIGVLDRFCAAFDEDVRYLIEIESTILQYSTKGRVGLTFFR